MYSQGTRVNHACLWPGTLVVSTLFCKKGTHLVLGGETPAPILIPTESDFEIDEEVKYDEH